jgi:hypothetical protein
MIVRLVVVRFTWLIVPGAAEGIWPAALVVVRFTWLIVAVVAEGIGPADRAVGLTG